mgnify:CR=1 FL=1
MNEEKLRYINKIIIQKKENEKKKKLRTSKGLKNKIIRGNIIKVKNWKELIKEWAFLIKYLRAIVKKK